jgi:ABC-type enterobactin transport system permease subunit
LTIGPTSVALVTDFVFADESAVRYSLSLVSAIAGGLVTWMLIYNLKHYRETLAETERAITRV